MFILCSSVCSEWDRFSLQAVVQKWPLGEIFLARSGVYCYITIYLSLFTFYMTMSRPVCLNGLNGLPEIMTTNSKHREVAMTLRFKMLRRNFNTMVQVYGFITKLANKVLQKYIVHFNSWSWLGSTFIRVRTTHIVLYTLKSMMWFASSKNNAISVATIHNNQTTTVWCDCSSEYDYNVGWIQSIQHRAWKISLK